MRLAAAVHWLVDGRISRPRAEAIAGVGRQRFASALALWRADRRAAGHDAAQATYAVELLGQPAVYRLEAGGRRVELDWKLHKALETVAFLALAPGRRATKEEIVEAVWWEAGSDAVEKNFHPTLSFARRSLGDRSALVLKNGSYLLDPDLGWEVDALRFADLVAAGDEHAEAAADRAIELWRSAWDLYRGPLMYGRDSPWILPRREALRRVYLRMLADLGGAAEERGEETLALDAYRSVLIEDPYDERIHLRMLTLYSRQGRRDRNVQGLPGEGEGLRRFAAAHGAPDRYHAT